MSGDCGDPTCRMCALPPPDFDPDEAPNGRPVRMMTPEGIVEYPGDGQTRAAAAKRNRLLPDMPRSPTSIPAEPQGIKNDTGKPAIDLIDAHFIEDVARVLTVGAEKYDVDNWKRGMALGKALGGVLRHTWAVLRGEYLDPETKLSHVAHAACGLMFVHYFLRTGTVKPDDRWARK